eukprot:jgi/Undpi1/4569/HiC_scaffold_18.g07923.m1
MFDIGMAEIIIIGGAAVLLLGKNDMPLVFRLVGRGVGKVSGLVQGGQARVGELSKGSELLQLQNEIRSNLDDLRVIKAELRGAVRLPAGVTGSSHPGSSALREQQNFRSQIDQPAPLPSPPNHNDNTSASPAGYVSREGGDQSATNFAGAATTATSAVRPPLNELPAAMRPPGVSSGKPFELPAEMRSPGVSRGRNSDSSVATGLGERAIGGGIREGTGRVTDIRGGGVGRVGDGDRGGGGERVAPAVAGAGVMGSGVGTRSEGLRAVKSVASPGGDRLQRLAMAEIGFAEKELYAHKTNSIPGGADILNETITDSLLQERYRQMLDVAQSSKSADGGDDPRS